MIFCSWDSRWALIALGEEPESVDLVDEIVHASPPSKAKADYQHPNHYKCVHYKHESPVGEEERKLLSRILHSQIVTQISVTRQVNKEACYKVYRDS